MNYPRQSRRGIKRSPDKNRGRICFRPALGGRGIKPRDPASPLHSVRDQFEYEFSDRKFCLTELKEVEKILFLIS